MEENIYNIAYQKAAENEEFHPESFGESFKMGLINGAKLASEVFEIQGIALQSVEASKNSTPTTDKRMNSIFILSNAIINIVSHGLTDRILANPMNSFSDDDVLKSLSELRIKARRLGSLLDIQLLGESMSDLSF